MDQGTHKIKSSSTSVNTTATNSNTSPKDSTKTQIFSKMEKILQKTSNLQKYLNFASHKNQNTSPTGQQPVAATGLTANSSMEINSNLPEIIITTPENENIPLFDENMFELFQGNMQIKECLKYVEGLIKKG